MVADISLSGIGVYSDQPIRDGKDLSVDIYFISSDGSIRCASVDGSIGHARKMRNIYYVGIQFKKDIMPAQHPLLYEYLMTLLRCSRK